MCLPIADPKARRLQQIGMTCLVLGLLPQVFSVTLGLPPAPLHFPCGLLLGVSIVTNLAAARLRCRRPPLPGA
jgi:hypothetical protein